MHYKGINFLYRYTPKEVMMLIIYPASDNCSQHFDSSRIIICQMANTCVINNNLCVCHHICHDYI